MYSAAQLRGGSCQTLAYLLLCIAPTQHFFSPSCKAVTSKGSEISLITFLFTEICYGFCNLVSYGVKMRRTPHLFTIYDFALLNEDSLGYFFFTSALTFNTVTPTVYLLSVSRYHLWQLSVFKYAFTAFEAGQFSLCENWQHTFSHISLRRLVYLYKEVNCGAHFVYLCENI